MKTAVALRCVTSLSFFAIAFLVACGPTNDKPRGQRLDPVFVRVPTSMLSQEFVQRTGFIRDAKRDDVFAFGYLERSNLSELPVNEAKDVTLLDEDSLRHAVYDAKTLETSRDPMESITPLKDVGARKAAAYLNHAALTAELQRVAAANPTLVALSSAGKSGEGRDLWYVKISRNPAEESDKPSLLYIANVHGDEVVGRELMVTLINELVTKSKTEPRIKALVDNAQIFIMPSMNPDGMARMRRFNAASVDLNRSFPDFVDDPHDTPAGRAVETQLIMAFHRANRFHLAASFHGGDFVVNLPWDSKPNAPNSERFGDDAVVSRLARQYADLNPDMKKNTVGSFTNGVTYGYEWYQVNGGLQDWSIYYRQAIHATMEVSVAKWPSASALPQYWTRNREALISWLEGGLDGVHLEIINTRGEPILGATVHVDSSQRDLTFSQSRVHRLTIPGAQEVSISAPGHLPATQTITASRFNGTFTRIVLASP